MRKGTTKPSPRESITLALANSEILSLSLAIKLGSIAVHADELLSPKGHPFDKIVLEGLLQDAEVVEWLGKMRVFLPVKR